MFVTEEYLGKMAGCERTWSKTDTGAHRVKSACRWRKFFGVSEIHAERPSLDSYLVNWTDSHARTLLIFCLRPNESYMRTLRSKHPKPAKTLNLTIRTTHHHALLRTIRATVEMPLCSYIHIAFVNKFQVSLQVVFASRWVMRSINEVKC